MEDTKDFDPFWKYLQHTYPIPGEWAADGICAQTDPELWFPERGDQYSANKARALCRTCPVYTDCYTWAISTTGPIYGVVAGMGRNELRAARHETAA